MRPGKASILVPNQGAVMLWQAFRSTAIELSAALAQSFGGLKAHKQLLAREADESEPSFKKGVHTVTLPTKPAAREKKIEVKAA